MKRRFFIPEVVQTSAMDCGPASLKALFGGFGIYLSYGRLREACQTDVDGTSMETLETIAQALGLDVTQSMIPADCLLLKDSGCLPAIVVVRLPDGGTHFVVVWRVHGPLVQVMDPAFGRVWMDRRRFLDSLYIHRQEGPRAAWEEWSRTEAFTNGLQQRMLALGIQPVIWTDSAHLDAALRLAQTLVDAEKLKRGADAEAFLGLCKSNPEQIPADFWTARNLESGDQMLLQGVVLLKTAGPLAKNLAEPLPASLSAVLMEQPPRVWAPVWASIRATGWLLPATVSAALLVAGAGAVVEILLFRGLFDLAKHLNLGSQRMTAFAMLLTFLVCLLALEWSASLGLMRLGRHLELRLRTNFLLKVPRLVDRYFQSRLISDMALRAHTLHVLRVLPDLAGMFVRFTTGLLFTLIAIAWFYPSVAVPATFAAVAAAIIPLLFQPWLTERDLRFRELSGSLSRFYFDALRGVRAIQAHCAERTLRAAQAGQLQQWAQAGLRQQTLLVFAESLQLAVTLALTVFIVARQFTHAGSIADLLLLIYWSLSICFTGQQIATVAWGLPALRNTLLRFMEVLGSPEEIASEIATPPATAKGIRVNMDRVSVVAAGHLIMDDVSLDVAAGQHVAIIGLSGAGKSSLVGLLLGWHKPAAGTICIDGAPLDSSRLLELRRETAWIDPQVHLFRAPLLDNLKYGNDDQADADWNETLENADLANTLEQLPQGLQTSLGEGGSLVSGGEGQRMRIGRALGRPGVRLAVFDEPACGLDRLRRQCFLRRARRHFKEATMFYITHDVTDTIDFDRVLVIEGGRIVEQGAPHALFESESSRYRGLFEQEKIAQDVWTDSAWRHLRMSDGTLAEAAEISQ
jgi:ABC-type bacteriocin/lantibiotic exporter with double-glycine peptidase domain